MKIGEALKEIRIKRNLTQAQAAKKIKISQTYLSQIESDKKKATADMIENICIAYNVPFNLVLWKSFDEKTVPKNRKKAFNEFKPLLDKIIEQLFPFI